MTMPPAPRYAIHVKSFLQPNNVANALLQIQYRIVPNSPSMVLSSVNGTAPTIAWASAFFVTPIPLAMASPTLRVVWLLVLLVVVVALLHSAWLDTLAMDAGVGFTESETLFETAFGAHVPETITL